MFRSATRRVDLHAADVVLYHPAPGNDVRHQPPATPFSPGQRLAVLAGENFPALFSPAYLAKFNTEFSYRRGSLFRDGVQYVLRAFEGAWSMPVGGQCWEELGLPPLLPTHHRHRFPVHRAAMPPLPHAQTGWNHNLTSQSTITWATSHCHSASGREGLVQALSTLLPIDMLGHNCFTQEKVQLASGKSVWKAKRPVPLEGMPRAQQEMWMRYYKFHLALENTRCDDYVTEKLYTALARGQVPIVLGAPNVVDHTPGPGSYIDVTQYPSPAALADHLLYLDRNDTAYMEYHAWRKRPFSTYGRILASDMAALLPIANGTGVGADNFRKWYPCLMCDTLQRAEPPPPSVPPLAGMDGGLPSSSRCGTVPTFHATCAPAYNDWLTAWGIEPPQELPMAP